MVYRERSRNLTHSLSELKLSDTDGKNFISLVKTNNFKNPNGETINSQEKFTRKTFSFAEIDSDIHVKYHEQLNKKMAIFKRIHKKKYTSADSINIESLDNIWNKSYKSKSKDRTCAINKGRNLKDSINTQINEINKSFVIVNSNNKSPIKVQTLLQNHSKDKISDDSKSPVFSSEYFTRILNDYRDNFHKVSVKTLDQNKKLLENLLKENKTKEANTFMTNSEDNKFNRKRFKRKTTKKTNNQISLIFHNFELNNSSNLKSNKRETRCSGLVSQIRESKEISLKNNSVVSNNRNMKRKFYISKKGIELPLNNIITESIMKSYMQMTMNKSKYNTIQKDESYKRIKSLEAKLPNILKEKQS